jgi:DNA-binding XRE family transcriptional regulator
LLEGKSFEELKRVKDASSVLVGGFTEAGEKQLKLAVRKPRKNRHSEFRTQEQVAKDTGFSRKTINKWECEQTSDDTNNKSNKYEYYESLRTDPEKNGAYKIWVKIVVEYKKKKGRKKSFVSFKEDWWEHNPDAIRMLHLK